MPDRDVPVYFQFFNEIGILEQLSRSRLEAKLPDGLIAPHFAVLNHLIRVRDGATPLALARAFQVPKTSMTHTLAGLEARGLVEMRPNPDDGRSKCVWITASGRALREQTIGLMSADLAELAEVVPPDRVAAIVPVLAELRMYLDRARDG